MPETLEHQRPVEPPEASDVFLAPVTETAQRRARDELRRQIAHLEHQLGDLFASAFPRQGLEWGVGAVGGPRVLTIRDLERTRDALALRLRDARAEVARQADLEEANRGVLEDMIAEPERHKWLLVSNQDIGEPGCRHWHSRPRWGILGMLFGWWRIRLSSGCPLAKGLRPPATAASQSKAPQRQAPQRQAPQRRRTSASPSGLRDRRRRTSASPCGLRDRKVNGQEAP